MTMLREHIQYLIKKHPDKRIVEEALKRAQSWAGMSTNKIITLGEVGWLVALLARSGVVAAETEKEPPKTSVDKITTVNPDGSRVIEVTATENLDTKSEVS